MRLNKKKKEPTLSDLIVGFIFYCMSIGALCALGVFGIIVVLFKIFGR